jgi:hypothetical protein
MTKKNMTPPLDDESHEKKLISLALKQAESELESGTATSQVLTHFLKLGSVRAQVELERLELENQLLQEKILAERSGQQINEMFAQVLVALKSYTYTPPGDLDDSDIF